MPVNQPRTGINLFELPDVKQVPEHHAHTQADPVLLALRRIIRQQDRMIELLEAAPWNDAPQGAVLFDRFGPGTFTSDVIRSREPHLVVEVYASGNAPNATVNVLDANIGGTPMPCGDANGSRVGITGNVKYFVCGVLDEVVVQLIVTSGVFSVRVGWANGFPRQAPATGTLP